MDYSKFQVEDFVTDEYFVKWVKKPDDESNAFWNSWLSRNPQSVERIREAREILIHLDFKTNLPPEGRFLEVWEKIIKAGHTDLKPASPDIPDTPSIFHNKKWLYGVAAAITFIILSTISLFIHEFRSEEIVTAYGEARTLSLPDNTRVTLNSNSRISFYPDRFSNGKREVFLTGEAFFSVVHKENHENFIVHTDELNVEVLGTKFNVNSRRGNTKVILQEGKVKLNMNSERKENALVMAPGEYVEFSGSGKLTRKIVDANDYLEWRNNRLIFVGTSLLEIGQLLEDNYGYEVVFQDDELKNRKFTGSSSAVEIEELLQKLSRLYNIEIQRDGNRVILKYRETVTPDARTD